MTEVIQDATCVCGDLCALGGEVLAEDLLYTLPSILPFLHVAMGCGLRDYEAWDRKKGVLEMVFSTSSRASKGGRDAACERYSTRACHGHGDAVRVESHQAGERD